jgi:hypothetical protein
MGTMEKLNYDQMENIDLVIDPENNFTIIMKKGNIYKNSLKE